MSSRLDVNCNSAVYRNAPAPGHQCFGVYLAAFTTVLAKSTGNGTGSPEIFALNSTGAPRIVIDTAAEDRTFGSSGDIKSIIRSTSEFTNWTVLISESSVNPIAGTPGSYFSSEGHFSCGLSGKSIFRPTAPSSFLNATQLDRIIAWWFARSRYPVIVLPISPQKLRIIF